MKIALLGYGLINQECQGFKGIYGFYQTGSPRQKVMAMRPVYIRMRVIFLGQSYCCDIFNAGRKKWEIGFMLKRLEFI